MQACACACIGEPRSEPGPGLPFCSSTQHLSALSLWNVFFFFFFLFLFIFISPQMSIFPDLSNACSAAGGEEGAFALSLSLPLASSAPAALLASFYFLQS